MVVCRTFRLRLPLGWVSALGGGAGDPRLRAPWRAVGARTRPSESGSAGGAPPRDAGPRRARFAREGPFFAGPDPERLARRLADLGLGLPALLVAEAHRPLLFFYAQGLRALGADAWAAACEDPVRLERWIATLEGLLHDR